MNKPVKGQHGSTPNTEEALTSCFIKKLNVFKTIGSNEARYLRRLSRRSQHYDAGEEIIHNGERYGLVFILHEGWAIRYHLLSDGRRQIANFILPGDFMCLNATIFEESEFTISTLTKVRCSTFRPEDIVSLTGTHPMLGAAIFWCNAREETMVEEHLISVGRRNARERVAHLLVELWRRQELVGLTKDGCYTLPLTQTLIADSVGLTPIYVNKIMRELTDAKLISCRRVPTPRIHIDNIDGLEKLAGYEDSYLHFTRIPSRTRKALSSA